MSDIFFEQLHIPYPKYNLNIGSGTHAEQTGKMLIEIEKVLLQEKPDFILVYGDTNSTLAGALAASKLLIPVIHVEAGLRSYNTNMPEEQNRVLTDHISKVLICPTDTAVQNLEKEGITQNVYQVGDVMCDSVLYYSKLAQDKIEKDALELNYIYEPKNFEQWYLATIHRAENTLDNQNLSIILNVFEKLDQVVVFPIHPRIKKMIDALYQENHYKNIVFIEPVDYLTMLYLTKNAIKVVTDSGGLQKEAYILDTPCVTVREQTEWKETLEGGYNILAKVEEQDLYTKIMNTHIDKTKGKKNYYGEGDSAKKIAEIIKNM